MAFWAEECAVLDVTHFSLSVLQINKELRSYNLEKCGKTNQFLSQIQEKGVKGIFLCACVATSVITKSNINMLHSSMPIFFCGIFIIFSSLKATKE